MDMLPFTPNENGYSWSFIGGGKSVQLAGGLGYRRADLGGGNRFPVFFVYCSWSLGASDYARLAAFFKEHAATEFTVQLILARASLETYTANLVPGTFRLNNAIGTARGSSATLQVSAHIEPRQYDVVAAYEDYINA